MTMTTPASRLTPSRSARRRLATRTSAGLLGALALVIAAPLAAQAHVTATPDTAAAGGYGTLTFAFSHGCDDSPTTALEISIPEGISSVSPTIEPGWDITVDREGETGPVTLVTYTAQEAIANGLRGAVVLGVQYGEDTAGSTLVFPVNQVCETGNTNWAEIAEDGVDPHSLDAPAPTVAVGEGSSGEHDADHTDSEASANAATDTNASSDTFALPVVLGGVGAVLGAGALLVSIVALRRARS